MKSMMKMEDRILSVIAFACYLFALTACGVATYALVTLSQTVYGNGHFIFDRAYTEPGFWTWLLTQRLAK